MMGNTFVAGHLRNLPIFQGFTPEQVAIVAPIVETYRMYPNEYIFRQGQPARGMYVLVEGRAALTQVGQDGSERMVAEMHANQYVSEAALFTQGTETLSLRVIETALVLFIGRERFAQLLAQHPELTLSMRAPAAVVSQQTHKKQFADQRADERVVRMVHRHWWVMAARSVIPLLIALALGIVGLVVLGSGLEFLIWGGTALLLAAWAVFMYVDWRNDYVIVTDERIVFVEDMLLRFQTHVRDTPLRNIQEVNYDIPADPFARLFNYGRVIIKTAGDAGNVVLDYVPDPRDLQQVVFITRQIRTEAARQQNRSAIDARLDQIFGPREGGGSAPPVVTDGAAPGQPRAGRTPSVTSQVQPHGWLSTRMTGPKGEIIYRKHLSLWALQVIWPTIAMVGALGLIVTSVLFMQTGALGVIELAAGVFMLVLGGVWFYLADWDWRNDYYVLGTDTISIIHKRPLWLRDVRDEILITQIDNVSSKKIGVIDSILNRGEVRIALVGDDRGEGKFFRHIYAPERVQAEISQRRNEALERARAREADRQQQTFLEYLAAYHQRTQPPGSQPTQASPVQPPPIQQSPFQPPAPPQQQTRPGGQGGDRPPGVPRPRGQ